MELSLPATAIVQFNERALVLCSKLRKKLPSPPRTAVAGESSEAHIPTKTLDQEDVMNFRLTGSQDGLGRQLSRCFPTPEGYVELTGDDYQSFRHLAYQVVSAGSLADSLSEEFVRSTLFDWLEKRHKSEIPADASFVDHLRTQAHKATRPHRIVIPLDSMSIEVPFVIGAVAFDYFRKDFFDSFETFLLSQKRNDPEHVQQAVSRFRKRYQGRVYASIQVEAEVGRAIELAKQDVDESLMLLRFFSPTALLPEIPSYFDILGRASVPTVDVLDFADAAAFPSIEQRVEEERQSTLELNSTALSEMKEMGLDVAGALVTKPSRTEIEELLLTCMSLVARAAKAAQLHEKIVFTLAAAETLLLGNAAEPIQQSLGQRLAFLTSDSADSRKAVITLVKDSYKCRSAYLHHGR